MACLWRIEPITLRTPGVMSVSELAAWAQVGKNTVPRLVQHFGIRAVTGHARNRRYSVGEIMRKILGVTLESADDIELLLPPLQRASWVSSVTGLSVSAINAAVCEKRGGLPAPVELTETTPDQAAARGRRWIPVQIEAHLRGEQIPFVVSSTPCWSAPSKRAPDAACNIFAAICGSNAEMSRQRQL